MRKILLIFPLFFLLACSVQKRKYQKGFYVSTQHHKKNNATVATKKEIKNQPLTLKPVSLFTETNEANLLSASSAKRPLIVYRSLRSIKCLKSNTDSLCDNITLKNGDDIAAKILEITPTEIKYKKCNAVDGPLYIVKKTDVFMVKYTNGTKEVFTGETSEEKTGTSNEPLPDTSYNGPKIMHPKAKSALIFAWLGIIPLLGAFACLKAIVDATKAKKEIKLNPNKYFGEERAVKAKKIAFVFLLINFGILFILRIILAGL